MKKFITHILIVIILVFLIDFSLGYILDRKFSLIAFKTANEAYNNKYELVLLGSSDMMAQYVTRMIADNLKIPTYNFSASSQNIYFKYIMINLMLNHGYQKPKYIIMETSELDFYDNVLNTETLNVFYPMYHLDEQLREVVDLQGWRTTCKLRIFKCYKHNSKLLHYANSVITLHKSSDDLGYLALEPVKYNGVLKSKVEKNINFDEQKIYYFYRLIYICKKNNIRLILVNAPEYELHENIGWIKKVNEIAKEESIIFLNYDNDPYFISHKELYHDYKHLNKYGAIEYTKKNLPDLKKEIFENNNY